MKKELALLEKFHEKFKTPILNKPSSISEDRYELRFDLMEEEIKEYLEAARVGNLEDIAKELADVLYVVYGTVLEHGLQEKIVEIFEEVHRSNMTKEYSAFSKPKKGKNYSEPEVNNFL